MTLRPGIPIRREKGQPEDFAVRSTVRRSRAGEYDFDRKTQPTRITVI
jgi:hypothetical protein